MDDPLLFAAGKFRGLGLGAVRHIQRFEQIQRPAPGLGVGLPGQHGQQGDVVGDVEKGNQVRRLEDEADAVAAQRPQVGNLPVVVVR